MKPDAKLKFFSMEDVLALENKGYFIKDNFLKSPELLDKIIEEVRTRGSSSSRQLSNR
jgi:hypothetical protein